MKTIKYEVTKFADGREEWRLDGNLHREDGPAVKYASGTECWYLNGKYHREGGPAVKTIYGVESWWLNGQCHREDGPAVKYDDGPVEYWIEGTRLTKEQFESQTKNSESCEGKVVEIEGIKYKLTKL